MLNKDCGDASHDMVGSDSGTSTHRTAVLKCRKCGVGHKVELRFIDSRRVKSDMTVFSASGSSTVSRAMFQFFMLSWDLSCQEIERDGYIVVKGDPETPPVEGL